MLRQASEHALHTILKIKGCLRLNTHNIDKVFRYFYTVSYELSEIFSKDNERLIQLLNYAESFFY